MADYTRLKVAHLSLRVYNTRKQQRADIRKALSFGYRWVTFTEIAKDRRAFRRIARRNGYRPYAPTGTDGAIAVRRDLVAGGWKRGLVPIIEHGGKTLGSTRPFGPKGLAWVAFDTDELGRIAVSTAHYLTGGRIPGARSIHGRANHYLLNRRIARAIGKWAREHGKGSGLAFYGGDQNIVDKRADTFFGEPLVTSWDELGKWPGTGHGNIDVIASFRRDGRVEAVKARAFRDAARFFHSDHFLIQTVYRVRHLAGR